MRRKRPFKEINSWQKETKSGDCKPALGTCPKILLKAASPLPGTAAGVIFGQTPKRDTILVKGKSRCHNVIRVAAQCPFSPACSPSLLKPAVKTVEKVPAQKLTIVRREKTNEIAFSLGG
jgi:hypothetical protein